MKFDEKYEEVMPDEYVYNMDKLDSLEDVVTYLKELGPPTLSLMPGVSLEDANKNPDVWVKVERSDGTTD